MIWIWKYIIIVLALLISGYSIALSLALIFACNPINKAWDITITWGSCIDRSDVYLATAITNAISDILLILIPIKIVWSLHLRPIQKIGVFALFSMGAL